MTGQRQRMRERREQLEAMLATASGRARSRSMVVDTAVGVIQRERPVAVGILAGSLAFRLFALMIPFTYVLVAGLGFAAQASAEEAQPRVGDRLGELLVASVAAATRTSDRGRWLALIIGGFATLLAAAAVLEVLWLALTWAMPRPPGVPWTALVPGACLFAVGFIAFNLAVSLYFAPRAARASTVYGSLGLALILLVSLFLFARLAVAAAELNATLWERRRPVGTGGDASA
jgi:uncharacterized BrkB/YihY/UPF0761 family membrane protein